MKRIICLFICLFAGSANATVILDDFSITESNLSFNVSGEVTSIAPGYNFQLLFGLVDNTDDWITSFDASASSWVEGSSNAVSIDYVYDLTGSYSDSLLTVSGGDWQLGDLMDITFNFVGDFNLANFDSSNFGMQVGYVSGTIVDSAYNIVEGVNATVPEPTILALLSLGLAGIGFTRRKVRS